MSAARDAFEDAVAERGWAVVRIRDSETFCRLLVTGDEELLVDLALDSPPTLPPADSIAGPTFGLEELAGRKLLALFDRAEARDFADVFVLSQRYGADVMCERAEQLDAGFDKRILASMIGTLERFDDSDLPTSSTSVVELRDFFRSWREQLLRELPDDDPA